MADSRTSDISGPIEIGEGKDKKIIYTATKVTPTTDEKGNKTYKMEVVQYDNAKGEGGKVIGTRNGDNIDYNEDASDDITGNAEAQKSINTNSKQQATKVKDQVATTSEEKDAFNKANGSPNEGTEAENEQNMPTLSNLSDAGNVLNGKAGKEAEGTRDSGFGTHIFPQALRKASNRQDYLKFDMMKYQPKDFDKKTFAFTERSTDTDSRSIGTVILPIPGAIQDSQSVKWGEMEMNPLEMAKANAALTGVTKGVGKMVEEILQVQLMTIKKHLEQFLQEWQQVVRNY